MNIEELREKINCNVEESLDKMGIAYEIVDNYQYGLVVKIGEKYFGFYVDDEYVTIREMFPEVVMEYFTHDRYSLKYLEHSKEEA